MVKNKFHFPLHVVHSMSWFVMSLERVYCKISEQMAFENLSCRYPPRPNPSITDHSTRQVMPWEYTEMLPHSGGGQKACFQGFQKCSIFAQQSGPRTKSFRGKLPTPFFCFDGYGLTLNLSDNKRIGEIRTKTRISTPMPPSRRGIGTNPAPNAGLPGWADFRSQVLNVFLIFLKLFQA
jgi:hypothetical protein